MNQNNEHDTNSLPGIAGSRITKIASVMMGISVIIACYSYAKAGNGFGQIALYALAAFIFVVAAFLMFIVIAAHIAAKNKNNFFLYDKKTKQNIPTEALTFEGVRSRVLEFMSVFKYRGKLYMGDLFSDDRTVPESFKPLFCYEILYELATDDGIRAESFLSFGTECASIFSKYLGQNDDHELAARICGFIYDFSSGNKDVGKFQEYIQSQRDHIKSKMLGYTVENIRKFD